MLVQLGGPQLPDDIVHFDGKLAESLPLCRTDKDHADPFPLEADGLQHILQVCHELLGILVAVLVVALIDMSPTNDYAICSPIESTHHHIGTHTGGAHHTDGAKARGILSPDGPGHISCTVASFPA